MKEITKTNIRAIKYINKTATGYLLTMTLNRLFNNLSVFINITMSALILNEIAGERQVETFIHLVGLTLLINAIIGITTAFMSRAEKVGGQKFWLGESKAMLDKFLHSDFEPLESGEVLAGRWELYQASKINGFGIRAMIETVSKLIDNIANILLSVSLMTSMIVLIATNPGEARGLWFIAAIFIMIAIFIAVSLRNSKILAHLGQEVTVENKRNSTIAELLGESFQEDAYQKGQDFRIYNMNPIVSAFKQKRLESLIRNNKKYWRGHKNTRLPEVLLTQTLNFAIYAFVAINALSGLFGIGGLVMYVGYIQRFVTASKDMATNIAMLRMNQPFLIHYLDYVEIIKTTRKGTLPIPVDSERYELEFHNVSFKYPEANDFALKNLNLKLEIGKRLAIVGMNGSGKTTMIKLMCRLYDPCEGKITLNGIDIREYDYDDYVGLFSVVFQDFSLFSFTLGENIAATSEYDRQQINNYLGMVGFGDRLNTMPDGLDTPLYKSFDENGVEISGGEAQKIALARALYKNAPFIVLDEPTSALDPIAEFEIYKRFNEIVEDNTAIYISHRLSSCRFCDSIAVFHEGELVEFGNHDTLLDNVGGKYSELWGAQVQYYA